MVAWGCGFGGQEGVFKGVVFAHELPLNAACALYSIDRRLL